MSGKDLFDIWSRVEKPLERLQQTVAWSYPYDQIA
jgi:hypothetical protein